MCPDGNFGDDELPGDFLVGFSTRQETKNLQLAFCEWIRTLQVVGRLVEFLQHLAGDLRLER